MPDKEVVDRIIKELRIYANQSKMDAPDLLIKAIIVDRLDVNEVRNRCIKEDFLVFIRENRMKYTQIYDQLAADYDLTQRQIQRILAV